MHLISIYSKKKKFKLSTAVRASYPLGTAWVSCSWLAVPGIGIHIAAVGYSVLTIVVDIPLDHQQHGISCAVHRN